MNRDETEWLSGLPHLQDLDLELALGALHPLTTTLGESPRDSCPDGSVAPRTPQAGPSAASRAESTITDARSTLSEDAALREGRSPRSG